VLLNFYEWFFVEAVQQSKKGELLILIKGDMDSSNPLRYERQLRELGGIYLQELGAQRRASTNDLNSVNFFELKNPNPLKFNDIFASFYNERLNTPQAFVSFSRPYFYAAGSRMSPYLPMSIVPQFETRYKISREDAIKKLFSILIDINNKFQQDIQSVESEKISLSPQQPFRPVTLQQPEDQSGKINISNITRQGQNA
jgi:hypothetical protein